MKKVYFLLMIGLMYACHSVQYPDGESAYQSFAPDGIPFTVAPEAWSVDGLGNHRAVVSVASGHESGVIARLPWRRADLRIDSKGVVVVNARTGKKLSDVVVLKQTPEVGEIAFRPEGKGEYYIYYLPAHFRKGWDDARYGRPWNDYIAETSCTDSVWAKEVRTHSNTLYPAKVLKFESRSRFNHFTPMGLIATSEEHERISQKSKQSFLVFPEDRAFPIRLTSHLPAKWAHSELKEEFKGQAALNEYYTWQLGIWADKKDLHNVHVSFSDFKNGDNEIPSTEFTCFNQEGVNWDCQPITFNVEVTKGNVQALWCGVQIPENVASGIYKGEVTVTAEGTEVHSIPVSIDVTKEKLVDKGDNETWRHSRLRWLNSTIGYDNHPVAPYEPMKINGSQITATGKKVKIAPNGLLEKVQINNRQVLSAPLEFIVDTQNDHVIFRADNLKMNWNDDGLVSWNSSSQQEGIKFDCQGYMEYDGYIRYHIKVSTNVTTEVKNVRLVTDYTPVSSIYFMGVGLSGGKRPANYQWNWVGPWDSYWTGGDLSGMHVEFRGGTYHGPLINDYKPAPTPVWSNGGKGRIIVKGSQVVAETGRNTLGTAPVDFEFAMLITPVKPLNTAKHFSERYFHADPKDFEKAAEEGANIANIHHARSLNPVINYPFIVQDELKSFIQQQHEKDRKVKLYYTIRELTSYVTEVYALKSLNKEIFAEGSGYGIPWLTEHLIDGYKPAWYTELPGEKADAALVLNGFSRWINYYLEGLRWMYENYQLDGIYMDDVSFDRNVMKRMRKISAKYRPDALVDLHSNTTYSIGPANQYTDFFPYIDRLWFGEHFEYNKMSPDEWFVTFSGIPFGQMSEMLQDGGNRYLGMVFGTTGRHSYSQYNPAPVWKLWDDFGIDQAQMIGFWTQSPVVRTTNNEVKATAYVRENQTLIALGNFDTRPQEVRLSIDWKQLGINPEHAVLSVPEVKDFQAAGEFGIHESIPVKAKEGYLIIVKEKEK